MLKKLRESSKGFKILWKYLSVYRKDLIFLSVLGVFSAMANGSVPYIMGKFLDSIIVTHTVFVGTAFTMSAWVFLLSIWGTAQLVAIGTDWTNERMSNKISNRLYIDYWVMAQRVLLSLPLSFHKDTKAGEIFSTLNRAANAMDSISGRIVIYLAPQFLSIAIGIGFAFFMNHSLAPILLLGVFVYILSLFKMVPRAIPLQRHMHKAWGESFREMDESSSNIISVKQFGNEDYQEKKIQAKFNQAFKFNTLINIIWSNIGFSQRGIVVSTQIVVLVSSVYLIQAGIALLHQTP